LHHTDLPRIFERSSLFSDKTAIIDENGAFTYADLMSASAIIASVLLNTQSKDPVAFITPPIFDYAALQWGIWRAGKIAVPLPISYPPAELEYILKDSNAGTVLVHPQLMDRVLPLANQYNIKLIAASTDFSNGKSEPGITHIVLRKSTPATGKLLLSKVNIDSPAMILYTSGTTSKPKGVVITHRNIESQVTTLVDAWEWTSDDHTLLILPLHHTHGIINVLTCALWSGAICEIQPTFDAKRIWSAIKRKDLTIFMAVPTIYSKRIT
jgi:malonyl-CoA/methylmalonyl-CoA synthetase